MTLLMQFPVAHQALKSTAPSLAVSVFSFILIMQIKSNYSTKFKLHGSYKGFGKSG